MMELRAAVLRRIDSAAEAARRARRDPGDPEALHRFRVDARRLAVCAKVLEKACRLPAGPRKRLRRALRATGPRRDAHVASLWLDDYLRRARAGGDGEGALARALARGGARLPDERRLWAQVDGALGEMRRAVAAARSRKSATRAAQNAAAEKGWRRLRRRLRRLDRTRSRPALHRARIAVKKLRYLLESMRSAPPGLPAPAELRGLQTALGEAHDRDVIAAGVAAAARADRLRPPARTALRQLSLEKRIRLSRAKNSWKSLLAGG